MNGSFAVDMSALVVEAWVRLILERNQYSVSASCSEDILVNLDFEIPIVMKRGSYIPYVYGIRRPGALNYRFFINQELVPWMVKWGAVEIKCTMDLIIG